MQRFFGLAVLAAFGRISQNQDWMECPGVSPARGLSTVHATPTLERVNRVVKKPVFCGLGGRVHQNNGVTVLSELPHFTPVVFDRDTLPSNDCVLGCVLVS